MRARSVVAAAAVLTLMAAGAGVTEGPPAAADSAGPDLSRFYHQKITWRACDGLPDNPEDMRCGKVTVPLDYADPGKGTVDIALARIAADTPGPKGSVLLNFGGPGGEGISSLAAFGRTFNDFTNTYDVVTFDPRGVGRSSPVTCGNTRRPDINGMPPGALLKAATAYYDACRKASGPVFPYVGTMNVARDLDVMRQVLGDRKLNFLGFSYGTRLGAVYAAQFPHKVGRMVLDGVDTLTEPLTQQALVSAQGQQTALDDFTAWCASRKDCALGSNARDARQSIVTLVHDLDAQPIPLGDGTVFAGPDLVNALGAALYQQANWLFLSRGLADLIDNGDPSGLMVGGGPASASHTPVSTVPADNPEVALTAVNCADDPDRMTAADLGDEAKYARLLKEYEDASPVFGAAQFTQILQCVGQPRGTDFIRKIRNVPAPKFLLVGTRGDPATPYRWTVETAKRLGDSAVVLDNRGEGHGAYLSSKCVRGKVDTFFLLGDLPASGSSCPASPETSADLTTAAAEGTHQRTDAVHTPGEGVPDR
ncbi:alpha/beta hydrolase [Streptomyces sp. NPDC058001]|uniref:alpha/beta hydrolase n=1 Tax=Streptomyces sp. NPDC058001 TaxID=3346300 RepID=UPI0036EF326D